MMDNTFTCTLSIEYYDCTFKIEQQGNRLWAANLDFSGIEMILTVALYLRYKHDLLVGKPTSEKILFEIGSPLITPEQVIMVTGRSLITGLPKRMEISSIRFHEQLKPYFSGFINTFERLINEPIFQENSRQLPYHLRSEINTLPIWMRGEYAALKGLTHYLRNELGREFVDPPLQ